MIKYAYLCRHSVYKASDARGLYLRCIAKRKCMHKLYVCKNCPLFDPHRKDAT